MSASFRSAAARFSTKQLKTSIGSGDSGMVPTRGAAVGRASFGGAPDDVRRRGLLTRRESSSTVRRAAPRLREYQVKLHQRQIEQLTAVLARRQTTAFELLGNARV